MNGGERLQNTVVVGCGEYNERCLCYHGVRWRAPGSGVWGFAAGGSIGRENLGKGREERGSRVFQRSAGVEAARKSQVLPGRR